MRKVHIEKKVLSTDESVSRLCAALAHRTGQWLVATDAAVATGLPLADAEQALLTLSTRHPCRVGVTDDGLVSVQFESLAIATPEGALARRWRAVRAFVARHRDSALALFTLAALPFIVLTGLAGAMAMGHTAELETDLPAAVRMPMLLFAGLLGLGWVVVMLFFVFAAALPLLAVGLFATPIVRALSPLADPSIAAAPDFSLGAHIATAIFACLVMWSLGFTLAKAVLESFAKLVGRTDAAWAPRLWRSIGGLVFGPSAPDVDRLADERRLLERVAALDGVVTTPDLMALFGWTPAEAEREVMRVMLDYGGDVALADDGTVLWIFDGFRSRTRAVETLDEARTEAVSSAPRAPPDSGRASMIEPAPPPRFFGCGRRFAILGLLLIVPAFIGPAVHPALLAFPSPSQMWAWHGPGEPDPILQGFGAWPAAFALAIMLARLPLHLRRRAHALAAGRRLELVALACDMPHGATLRPRDGDTRILADLAAEVDAGAGSQVHVRFPWILAARQAAHAIRTGQRAPVDFG